jgi:hypothetical protein
MYSQIVLEGDRERLQQRLGEPNVLLRRRCAGFQNEHEHRRVTLGTVQRSDDHVGASCGVNGGQGWRLRASDADASGLTSATPCEEFLGL